MRLPASRKARALLGFLIVTNRPHRRERLCELFWDMPDDPKAALRWALSKLRKVVDLDDDRHIHADRERVSFDPSGTSVDLFEIRGAVLASDGGASLAALEAAFSQLDALFLDGLEEAGDETFQSWLTAERADIEADRIRILRELSRHPENSGIVAAKWQRLWQEADPLGFERSMAQSPQPAKKRAEKNTGTDAVRRSLALREQRIGFCEVRDGTKIAYATVGSGPPLLKAANWLTHIEYDWNSPIWGASFAEIARDRMLIRYDERGCGLSDWKVSDISFDAFVEDLEVVADKLEIERFPLLGISQGAAVCIEYAVRHPERVSGLILLGAYASGWQYHASDEEKERRKAVRKLTEIGWGTDNPAYRHIFSQTFMPDAAPDELAWFDEFQRLTTSPINAARFQDAFGEIDVRHRLADVRAPTLVLHSKGDQRIPLDQGRVIASAIPNAQFVPLDSRNHVLVDYEPAWQVSTQAIGRFLAELQD